MKTIIEMAREADGLGFVHDAGDAPSKWQFTPKELERFAALVRADEREACAKLLEKQKYMVLEPLRTYTADALARSNQESVMYMAHAIRARGNT